MPIDAAYLFKSKKNSHFKTGIIIKKIVLKSSYILSNNAADWFVIARNNEADLGYLNVLV